MDAMKKQQAAEKAQQEFENQMSMVDADYRRAQIEAMRGKAAPRPQPGAKFLGDFESVMGYSFLEVPEEQRNTVMAQYGAKKRAAPPKAPKTLGEIESEAEARARGAAAGRGDGASSTAYGTDIAKDIELINKTITKYDTEIGQYDKIIADLEGQVAATPYDEKIDKKVRPVKTKFYSDKLAQVKKERENLLGIKDHLASLGSQVGSGKRMTNMRRAELMSILSGVDRAKKGGAGGMSVTPFGGGGAAPSAPPVPSATEAAPNATAPERRTIATGPDAGVWERIPGTESWRKIS
jgi:hypothetical protein